MTEVEYEFEPIHGIEAWDGVDVILHYAPQQRVVVRAGKFILPKIHISQAEGTVYVRDDNHCNWSKTYEAREVHFYLPTLKRIFQNGYGLIRSEDTVRAENLQVKAPLGSGDIDLSIKAELVEVESSKYGTIRLRGEAKNLKVNYTNNNAIFDGRSLKAENIEIFHKSNNDFRLYPVYSLTGKLLARGNVYLFNNPQQMDVQDLGHGNILFDHQEE